MHDDGQAGPEVGYFGHLRVGRFMIQRIAPGGQMQVNSNGGGLSCGPQSMYGMFLIVVAVKQLRGTAGERQLPRCDVALCHGNGGIFASQVTAPLGNAATV